MAVIINEFEVVLEPSKPRQPNPDQDQDMPPLPTWTPRDIGDVVRRQAERLARIRALS